MTKFGLPIADKNQVTQSTYINLKPKLVLVDAAAQSGGFKFDPGRPLKAGYSRYVRIALWHLLLTGSDRISVIFGRRANGEANAPGRYQPRGSCVDSNCASSRTADLAPQTKYWRIAAARNGSIRQAARLGTAFKSAYTAFRSIGAVEDSGATTCHRPYSFGSVAGRN